MPTPTELRELKAQIVRKGLTLRAIAQAAGVEYYRASSVLSGRFNDEHSLGRLRSQIESAPLPEENKNA